MSERPTWKNPALSVLLSQVASAPEAGRLSALCPGLWLFVSPQNWFRTSADSPPRHRSQGSLVPKKESLAGGKKRGRRPKERLPEEPAPKTAPRQEDWPPGGRDKGAQDSTGRKVGASSSPEK